jgi:hypothetical protein
MQMRLKWFAEEAAQTLLDNVQRSTGRLRPKPLQAHQPLLFEVQDCGVLLARGCYN